MYKQERVEVNTYKFAGFTLLAKKYQNRFKWTWLIVCQDCGQQVNVRQLGSEHWFAKCLTCKIEYTITPGVVYKAVETNLEKLM
jgi:hypothetical protein